MQSTLIIALYQYSDCTATIAKLTSGNGTEPIAESVTDNQTHWQALRTILDDVRTVGADHLRIFSTVPFKLDTLPEEPAHVERIYMPSFKKYWIAKWGGNADYWRVLSLIHEYKSYSFKVVKPEQIPGTVKLWQDNQ